MSLALIFTHHPAPALPAPRPGRVKLSPPCSIHRNKTTKVILSAEAALSPRHLSGGSSRTSRLAAEESLFLGLPRRIPERSGCLAQAGRIRLTVGFAFAAPAFGLAAFLPAGFPFLCCAPSLKLSMQPSLHRNKTTKVILRPQQRPKNPSFSALDLRCLPPPALSHDSGCPMFAQLLRANVGPSATLREIQRSPHLRVLFPAVDVTPRSAIPSCNSQLQLHAFPRSVDYAGLKSHLTTFRINTSGFSCKLGSVVYKGLAPCLTPFIINTSKNFRKFRISLISRHFNSTGISTSMFFAVIPPRINTSKKIGGWGVQLQLVATGRIRFYFARKSCPLASLSCSPAPGRRRPWQRTAPRAFRLCG